MEIPEQWTFKSAYVAGEFDEHVQQQLPWYSLATGITAHVARHYVPEGGRVYDIGAATGNIGNAIREVIEDRKAEFIAIDNSPEMAAVYKGPGELLVGNAQEMEYQPFDLAICFLVMMFLSIPERARLLETLRAAMRPGGAIILFDKCEAGTGYIATVLWRLTLNGKVSSGVDSDEILAKELSLAGVQRPVRISELGESIEIFRFGDFAGWILT